MKIPASHVASATACRPRSFAASFARMLASRFASLVVLLAIAGLSATGVQAQGAAQSKDYWVSFVPSKANKSPIWLLLCTNVPNTRVRIEYADKPDLVDEFTINPNQPREYKVYSEGGEFLAKPRNAEVVEKRAVHVTASHPISLQGFTDADNNVGLFLIMPTSTLGQSYIIAAFNDQNKEMSTSGGGGGWDPAAFDSTGGAFVIVAVEDNTTVDIKVNGPTSVGRKYGDQWRVTLNKGQTYWVQGGAQSSEDDLTRSTVKSSKPVAVFAGCEIMRAYDAMVLQNHFDYNDYVVEQMIPTEVWGTEYYSIPFTNKRGTARDTYGDLYRVIAAEENTVITVNGQRKAPGAYWEFSLWTDDFHLTSDKPVMVVQYDYYFDFHQGIDYPRTSNSEMVLVPRHNWRKNATFKVPTGYAQTYFHVVAHKDSIDKIKVSIGGADFKPISSMQYAQAKVYPPRNDYKVRTIQLATTAQCILQGPCDFAVYNYGTRDNDQIKATYGYASAAAASFGSITKSTPPKMAIDSNCTEFNLTIFDTGADGRGIGEMYLVDDPLGLVSPHKYVSKNVHLTIEPFDLGSKSVKAKVTILDPLQDAFAAIYVTNRAGKDTIFTFHYSGTLIAANPSTQLMSSVLVGKSECKTYKVKNTGSRDVLVDAVLLRSEQLGLPQHFTLSTGVALPTTIKPGAELTVTACYTASDTGIRYVDTLLIKTGCLNAVIAEVKAEGAVPTIYADNMDFGVVEVGQTVIKDVAIKNLSDRMPLMLTRDIIEPSPEFAVVASELARFPITLPPLGKTTVRVSYTPTDVGADTSVTVWGRDVPTPYDKNNIKEWSVLTGAAVKSGVYTTLATGVASTICSLDTTFTFELKNTGDAQASIESITVEGPDKNEFSIVRVGAWPTVPPTGGARPIDKRTSEEIQVRFKADLSQQNPWRDRAASLVIITDEKDSLVTKFTATVSHPEMALDQSAIHFGESEPNVATTKYLRVENPGTSELIITSFTISDPATFTVVSGLTVGQTIPAGGFTDVVLQALPTTTGAFAAQLLINGNLCSNSQTADLKVDASRREVLATGANYPLIWTCHQSDNNVTFTNKGSNAIKLQRVEINGDTPGSVNWEQFVIVDPQRIGTTVADGRLVTFDGGYLVVQKGETVSFPVRFDASVLGLAEGGITFTYDSGDGVSNVLQRLLTGEAKHHPIDITTNGLQKNYTSFVDGAVVVPLQVKQDIGTAEIYAYDVDVRFAQDLFHYEDGGVVSAIPNVAVTASTRTETIDNVVYTVISIHGKSQEAIPSGYLTLANINLVSRLTRADSSKIEPVNVMFYDRNAVATCYTPTTIEAAQYVQEYMCGDATIQNFLRNSREGVIRSIGNSPNPVKAATNVNFHVAENDVPVTIEIFNQLGVKVATLVEGERFAKGTHGVMYNASTLTSGTYVIMITAESAGQTSTTSSIMTVHK